MRLPLSLLWTFDRRVGRVPYLAVGLVLTALKVAIDYTVAEHGFGRAWSPMNYLIWPDDKVVGILELPADDRRFALTMLGIAVPFLWIGVMLTQHRLADAGLPRWLVVLFFAPVANLLLFAALSLLPTRDARTAAELPLARPVRTRYRRLVGDSYWRSGLASLLVTVPVGVGFVALETVVLGSYGFSLFVGVPFAIGLVSVLVFGLSKPQPYGLCVLTAFTTAFLASLGVLAVALEGVICLLMAAPIGAVLVLLGASVGYVVQSRPWVDHAYAVAVAVFVALPALMAAESVGEPEPELRAVVTAVEVDAPPEVVWNLVVAFPPLPEPDDWVFRTGIAYPVRAEIDGRGPGACRYCVFSTGPFVEPIEVWDEPRLLRFQVTDQPPPMTELSPFHIHPPHLDHYLVSKRGQFVLEPLPGGRTRLEGTTWYANRMWPGRYWGVWSDDIIRRVHGRVLTHIKREAEGR